MGRAFEYRKARKLKRWGNMARTFTKLGKEIAIAVKAGGGLFAKCFVQIITLSVVPALRLHREYEYSMNSTLKEP